MSFKKLQRNIDKRAELEGPLIWKPVIISDSKGRYLKDCGSSENQVLWCYKSGSTTLDRFTWLSQNLDKLIVKYGKIHIYVWTGTCDMTSKEHRYIHLKSGNPLTTFQASVEKIVQLVNEKPDVRLTFLHIPYFSISIWNEVKGHSDAKNDTFKEDDRKLTEYIDSANVFIDNLNERFNTYSPKLEQDLVRSRKRRNSYARYSYKFSLLRDGVHPTEILAKSWYTTILRQIYRDCV